MELLPLQPPNARVIDFPPLSMELIVDWGERRAQSIMLSILDCALREYGDLGDIKWVVDPSSHVYRLVAI